MANVSFKFQSIVTLPKYWFRFLRPFLFYCFEFSQIDDEISSFIHICNASIVIEFRMSKKSKDSFCLLSGQCASFIHCENLRVTIRQVWNKTLSRAWLFLAPFENCNQSKRLWQLWFQFKASGEILTKATYLYFLISKVENSLQRIAIEIYILL